MRLAALGLGVATAAALLVGCTSGSGEAEFDAADFRSGDCAAAARPVFAIQALAERVVDSDDEASDVVDDLRDSQQTLIDAVAGMSDTALRDAAQKVVDAVGFFRIGVDAKNFTPTLAEDLDRKTQAFLTECSAAS